jgi:hypothetical protein
MKQLPMSDPESQTSVEGTIVSVPHDLPSRQASDD